MVKTDRIAAARTFVRSCNVLLKQAALYGLKHSRSAAQLELTWNELRKALPGDAKLILCASADRILLDGAPLGSGTAERSLAAFLVAAGIGRIDFDPRITLEEFTAFVQICSTGKAVDVLSKLRPELGKTIGNIRIVEFRILDTSALAEAPAGPSIPGTGIGGGEFSGAGLDLGVLLSDPHKLLQLIDAIPSVSPATASGTGTSQNTGGGSGGGFEEGGGGGFQKGSGSGAFEEGGGGGGFQKGGGSGAFEEGGGGGGFQKGGGSGGAFEEGGGGGGFQKGGSGGGGSQKGEGGGGFQKGGSGGGDSRKGEGGGGFQEGEVVGVIQWLTRFAGAENGAPGPESGKAPSNLQQAIQKILPAKPTPEMRGALLLQLAEHVALRAVSDKYKRQGLNVTAIQQMLDRMRGEIDNLRKVLHLREEELGRAGLPVESNADILDHKFWKDVPEDSKRKVLLSPDAWVLPPIIIRSFVQPLLAARAEVELANAVMQNYCRFLDGDNLEARTKIASNIGKLADLFSRVRYLRNVVECVGENLVADTAGELAPALTESFVLLGQEAVSVGDYSALDAWLGLIGELEGRDAALAVSIRTRVTVEERVPEMVRIATEPPQPPEGLIEVLKRMPDPAARYIAERFAACSTREEGIRLARVLSVLGPVSIDPLREMLYRGSPADAIAALGILTMLDPDFLRPQLAARLAQWTRAEQDAALRQISASGTPERGSLLLDFIDCLDPFVLCLAIDEIGMAGSVSASKLMHLARGLGRARGLPYLRVKAIEALGRLGEKSAAPLLTQFLTERAMLSWQQPREIRVVAAQSLQRIDPDAARQILPATGLTERELSVGPATEVNPSWIRQRKYSRIGVENNLVGSLAAPGGASSMKILDISLGGGFGNTVRDPQGQTEAALDLYIGLRKLPTQVFIRRTRPHEVCFEFVDISLDDRSRLREFLAEKLDSAGQARAELIVARK